tara:strand:- start:10167 stop:10679 length:513 start_codon:yes stop_codon:yes gene_type:complete
MKYLLLLVLGVLIISGCEGDTVPKLKPVEQDPIETPADPPADPPPEDNLDLIENVSENLTKNESGNLTGNDSLNLSDDPRINEINIVARRFSFEPDLITVKVGDKVVLSLRSIDVQHGISIPDFGVNLVASPGQEDSTEFIADKVGQFPFRCSVFCGDGHDSMSGMFVVE